MLCCVTIIVSVCVCGWVYVVCVGGMLYVLCWVTIIVWVGKIDMTHNLNLNTVKLHDAGEPFASGVYKRTALWAL